MMTVGAQDGPAVLTVELLEPLEPAVDVNIVNQEVNQAIN